MPLFDYKCTDCEFKKEHFVFAGNESAKTCPKCKSIEYKRQVSSFKLKIEYSDAADREREMDKDLGQIFKKIGQESLGEDTKTLDNLFGTEKVQRTFHETDD